MKLRRIVEEEDSTRPTTASINFAKPPMEFPDPVEVITLNAESDGLGSASVQITTSKQSIEEMMKTRMTIFD